MSLDVQSVLGALTQFRQERPDTMDVALMTLVVFFDDPDVGAWARDRVRTFVSKDPARVIVLDGTQPECILCTHGDWIELGIGGSDPDTLQSAVAALSLPQTPVVLVWASAHIQDDARFAGLAPQAMTVVCNSSVMEGAESGLSALIAFARAHPDVSISDLAYLRLIPWQESIAFFFDGKNVVRELFDLRRVEISSGSKAEAYYLLGWLASRLEWTMCSATRFCNRFGTEIEFTLVHDGPPRRIRRIALNSSQTQFVAELRGADAEVIALTVTGAAHHPDRSHPINNVETAALIERAILTGHKDRVFVDTLVAAGEILSRARN
jgi:glucose-6-phosphate dehydrogenase assembly protein OpcA